jgi:hypothetical protein
MKTPHSHVSPPVTFEAILRYEVAVLATLVMFAVGGGTDFGVFLAFLPTIAYGFPSEAELVDLESGCPASVRLRIYLFAAARIVAVIVGACLCFHMGSLSPTANAPRAGT